MQEFTEEKGKLKKIEWDLTDIKRMVYDRKGEQRLKSTVKVQTPVDVSLSNTNKLTQTSYKADAAVLTPVPIIPYINEVADVDYIHNLSNIPFHQNNSNTRSVMEQRMQIKSYGKRQSKIYPHYRLNEQLQSYRAKHKGIFMNNNSRVPEAPARNTQINRSHIPMKCIPESNIHRKSNKAPSHRRVETENLTRRKDRTTFSAKNTTKESGRHLSNRPPFYRRPTNHVPAMYRSHRINSPPPYQIQQLMKLPSYQPHRLTTSPSYQPASTILPSFPPAFEGMVGLSRDRISSNQVPLISLQNHYIIFTRKLLPVFLFGLLLVVIHLIIPPMHILSVKEAYCKI